MFAGYRHCKKCGKPLMGLFDGSLCDECEKIKKEPKNSRKDRGENMTNGIKLLSTYPNLYVCVLYFDMNFIHLRDRNINYKMNDNKTCIKIPIDWWDAEYKAESEVTDDK